MKAKYTPLTTDQTMSSADLDNDAKLPITQLAAMKTQQHSYHVISNQCEPHSISLWKLPSYCEGNDTNPYSMVCNDLMIL